MEKVIRIYEFKVSTKKGFEHITLRETNKGKIYGDYILDKEWFVIEPMNYGEFLRFVKIIKNERMRKDILNIDNWYEVEE